MTLFELAAIWGMFGWILAAWFWLKSEGFPRGYPPLQEGKGYQPRPTDGRLNPPIDEPQGPKPNAYT